MTTRFSVVRGARRIGAAVSAIGLTFAVLGCGEESPTVQPPAAKAREEASTKNMENFMKSKPTPIGPGATTKKNPSAPQTK